MNFVILILFGCLFEVTNSDSISTGNEKTKLFFEKRPLVGHLKQDPFSDLYKVYTTYVAFLPGREKLEANDFRNYMPSGNECYVFLKKFQSNNYQITDLHDFIVMDACLGYLYESQYHTIDIEAGEYTDDELKSLVHDRQLKSIHNNTAIELFNNNAKHCLHDLLARTILILEQYNNLACNSHWLQVFLSFARCQNHIPKASRDNDSYMKILYPLLRSMIFEDKCYFREIRQMNEGLDYIMAV